jgi:glutamate/tyrosine decarboxylase-like PLP-dependent enzyme
MTKAERMHDFDPKLTDLVLTYVRDRVLLEEAPLDFPGVKADLEKEIEGMISANGHDPVKVLDLYSETLAKTILSTDSPRFLSFIPAAPTKASLLFDTVVGCASIQGMSWLEAAGALVAENQVLRWIADLAGMPASAGGTFVSGGSAANLSALTVARDVGRARTGSKEVRIALSHQAHSSIGNSLHILSVEPFLLETDDDVVTEASIRRSLAKDTGTTPIVGIAVTAGTTNAGIVDDLVGVAKVAKENNWWFHVDGAYGGAGLLSPLVRDLFNGIEHADSFITDPHKWWFAPFDCAAILFRDPALAVKVHTQDASYLDVLHDGLPIGQFNPTDVAYHLTRRARGLPFWFSLAVYGTDAYRDAVNASIELARETAKFIETLDHIELVKDPVLSVVIWRRIGWQPEDYERLQTQLLNSQIAFVTPSKWKGETVGRFAFLHPGTTLDLVKEIFEHCK